MAESSRIYFETTRDVFKLQPPPTETKQFQQVSRTVAVYDLGRLLDEGVTNIVASYNKPTVFGIIPKPDLHAARYVTGHGQEKGGIVTKIVNNSPKPLTIVFLDVIPWYLRCYLHSLTIKNSRGRTLEPLRTEFLPGRARQRPYMLELVGLTSPNMVQVLQNFLQLGSQASGQERDEDIDQLRKVAPEMARVPS